MIISFVCFRYKANWNIFSIFFLISKIILVNVQFEIKIQIYVKVF